MSHPLLDQLTKLRHQIRRLLWMTGLSWVVVWLTAGLLIAGLMDWQWHIDDRWLRTALLLAIAMAVGLSAWRKLISPLRFAWSNVGLARHLEQQFPALRGRLTAAVEFLEHGVSPQLGSPELQQRLIEQTTNAVVGLEFTSALDRRNSTRAMSMATGVLMVSLLLCVANSAVASTALSRLLWPFGDRAWPKRVELQLVRGDLKPLEGTASSLIRTVQGQPLDLFVVNTRGTLPEPVLLEFRRRGAASQTEPLRKITLRSAADQPREAAAVRAPFDEGTIELRAIGGDDQEMPWRTLEIVPPVKIEAFRVKLTPPDYTGEPITTAPENGTQLRALVGTRLQITAKANRPIRAARWHDPARPEPIAGKVDERQTGAKSKKLNQDKPTVAFEVTIAKSGTATHRLSLVDQDGFENSSALQLEVVGVADPSPVVALDQPAIDQLVTSNAVVSLLATAKDERRLKEITIEFRVEATAATSTTPTISTTGEPGGVSPRSSTVNDEDVRGLTPPGSPAAGDFKNVLSCELALNDAPQKEAMLRTEWALADLSLIAGDRLLVRAIGKDFCDVGEPRVGRSSIRTLTVVSAEAKATEIANRLDLLLHDLETLATRESQAKDQTDELRVQAEKAGELRPQDRDSLKRVDLDQRQINNRLIGRGDGILARAQVLLAELEANRLTEDVTRRRLTEIGQAIDPLGQQSLPHLESTLGRVVKQQMENENSRSPQLADDLAEVGHKQEQVLSTLNGLVRNLSQWRDRRELAREIADLTAVQEGLNRDTAEVAPNTIGKTASQLTTQQQADIAKLADRQSRQAEKIEQLRQRLKNSAEQSSNDNETAARAASEVADELDQRGLAAKAREAAQEVSNNSLGQARQTQQKLAAELKSLAEKLEQTPTASASDAVRDLKELEAQLDKLRDQQRELLEETQQAASTSDKLTPEQLADAAKVLQAKQGEAKSLANELASRMKSQPAGDSVDSLRRSTKHMQQAEQQLGEKQLAQGAGEQQEALDDLEQTQRELAAARRQAEQEKQAEKADELSQAIQELVTQQKTVIEETVRLADEQTKAGKWTRPLTKAVLSLSGAEQGLAEETRQLAESLRDIEAVKLILDRAASDLTSAAKRLEEKKIDDETRAREQSALRSLQTLADALNAKSPAQANQQSDSERSADKQPSNPEQPPAEPVPPIAQLKLLRQLQEETRSATEGAERRKKQADVDDPQRQQELKRLAAEQQAVSNATERLLDRFPAPMADDEPNAEVPDESKPREATTQAMRDAHERLAAKETGEPTQTAQQTAVSQIDALLKLWQQRADRQQANSQARSGQPRSSTDQEPKENAKNSTDGDGNKPTGRENKQARNSSERQQTGPDREGELMRQRQLREAVWGHLPPALREKMLNLPHDKTLPKYSEHIRRYYEALAEQ